MTRGVGTFGCSLLTIPSVARNEGKEYKVVGLETGSIHEVCKNGQGLLTVIDVASSVRFVEDGAFVGSNKVVLIRFGGMSKKTIADGAFSGMKNLKQVGLYKSTMPYRKSFKTQNGYAEIVWK